MKNELLDFFKGTYDRELSRKQEIEDGASNTLTTIALLFAFLSFYLLNWPDNSLIYKHKEAYYAFAITLSFGVLFIVVCMVYMSRFYFYGSLMVLSSAEELYKYYRDELIPYVKKNYNNDDDLEVEEKAKSIFFNSIMTQYIDVASKNAYRNDKRADMHYDARRFLFMGFIFLTMSFAPYFIVMGDEINMNKMEIYKSIKFQIQ